MNTQAQIYLADQRGCSQTDTFRSFHTFNFGDYVAENRQPFGDLEVFNDTVIKPLLHQKIQLSKNTNVVIIPVIGGLEYNSSIQNGFLGTGNTLLLSGTEIDDYTIINPYETDYINFVQIHFNTNEEKFKSLTQEFGFGLNPINTLKNIFSVNNQEGFIGKYGGRKKGEFTIKNPQKGVFVFVVDGVFEVQDRLLHARDGLAISDIEMIDFEALSDGAVILLISVKR
jgi:quercetin 2,3-dioxygenase